MRQNSKYMVSSTRAERERDHAERLERLKRIELESRGAEEIRAPTRNLVSRTQAERLERLKRIACEGRRLEEFKSEDEKSSDEQNLRELQRNKLAKELVKKMKAPIPPTPPHRGEKASEGLSDKRQLKMGKDGAGVELADHPDGVLVTSVLKGGANEGILHVGDVIIKVNRTVLSSARLPTSEKKMKTFGSQLKDACDVLVVALDAKPRLTQEKINKATGSLPSVPKGGFAIPKALPKMALKRDSGGFAIPGLPVRRLSGSPTSKSSPTANSMPGMNLKRDKDGFAIPGAPPARSPTASPSASPSSSPSSSPTRKFSKGAGGFAVPSGLPKKMPPKRSDTPVTDLDATNTMIEQASPPPSPRSTKSAEAVAAEIGSKFPSISPKNTAGGSPPPDGILASADVTMGSPKAADAKVDGKIDAAAAKPKSSSPVASKEPKKLSVGDAFDQPAPKKVAGKMNFSMPKAKKPLPKVPGFGGAAAAPKAAPVPKVSIANPPPAKVAESSKVVESVTVDDAKKAKSSIEEKIKAAPDGGGSSMLDSISKALAQAKEEKEIKVSTSSKGFGQALKVGHLNHNTNTAKPTSHSTKDAEVYGFSQVQDTEKEDQVRCIFLQLNPLEGGLPEYLFV